MTSKTQWDSATAGPLTEGAVRALHKPASDYRISVYRYPSATRYMGSMIGGTCYVLAGQCRITVSEPMDLAAGDVMTFDGGEYRFEAVGAAEVVYAMVWRLPWPSPDLK